MPQVLIFGQALTAAADKAIGWLERSRLIKCTFLQKLLLACSLAAGVPEVSCCMARNFSRRRYLNKIEPFDGS